MSEEIQLVKKNKTISRELVKPNIHPTNVDGHYPGFILPGIANFIPEETREMSTILESFLPQLARIGISLKSTNNLIREIVASTEVFRRLLGISQIELLPFAFSAVPWFTRYTHSCLTYVFGEYVIDKLNHKLKLSPLESEAAKLCFLLHDLGHGPFSHLAERAFKTPRGRYGKVPLEYDHEHWTTLLLDELKDSLFDTYKNPYLPENTSSIPFENLKKCKKYNLEIFSQALKFLSDNDNFIVSQLIAGQIDLDRLSNYLGDRLVVSAVLEEDNIRNEGLVKFLSSNDETVENIKLILNNLVIASKDLNGNKCKPYIAIDEKATTAVIHFLLDRHIIRYYLLKHYRREASNNVLEKILIRAKNLVDKRKFDLLGNTDFVIRHWLSGHHTAYDFMKLDDQLVFNQIRRWAKYTKDPILKDLTLRFTANHFFSAYACERDGKPFVPSKEYLEKIKDKVLKTIKLEGITEDEIAEYYFSYEETTSKPYHTDREEVLISLSNGSVKKLSDYINDTDNEFGKVLLTGTFERYLIIVPSEVEL